MKATLYHNPSGLTFETELTHSWPRGAGFIVYCFACSTHWATLRSEPGPEDGPLGVTLEAAGHLCLACGSGSLFALNEALEYTDFTIPDELLAHELTLWANRTSTYWPQGTYYL